MRFYEDKDKLKVGDCMCVIRNKYTGWERVAYGSVVKTPYKKNASQEAKKKYGKNLVYVVYSNNEDIIRYCQ